MVDSWSRDKILARDKRISELEAEVTRLREELSKTTAEETRLRRGRDGWKREAELERQVSEQRLAVVMDGHRANIELRDERDELREQNAVAVEAWRVSKELLSVVEADRDRLRAENVEARQHIHDLLQSADCSWELDRAGHDWAESVERARLFLITKLEAKP